MAIDTVCLRSPYIGEDVAKSIENECMLRQGLDLKTGEVLYQITTGSLEGSYDSRISIKVMREEWKAIPKAQPIKVQCKPYLQVEGSVHKALLGHNVQGGPQHFIASCRYMVGLIEDLIGGQPLPNADLWQVRRVDTAEVFLLPSFDLVQEWFRGTNTADYPRRSVTRYGLSGIYAQGSTSVLKFYHKGPEFQKHDRKRLVKFMDSDKIFNLQEVANRTIRVELEIKPRKLEYDFGHSPLVWEVTEKYLNGLLDKEVKRFLKEGAIEMKLVRNAVDVEKRLFSSYKSQLAGTLLGTWFKLSTLGEDYVKKTYTKRTFYRQRKQLVDVGISWKGTDVVLKKESTVLDDFVPIRSDPRCSIVEFPEIEQKLSKYYYPVEHEAKAQ